MSENTQQVFLALADPTRRELLERIASEGPQTATELAAAVPITRQGVAKHLAILSDAGLLTMHQNGRDKRYALKPEPFEDAVSWIHAVGAAWDARLERLRTLLEDEEE